MSKRLRYLPPNLVTLLSLALGLVSMHHAARGNLEEAAWFILYSVLLDKLDGTLARLLGAQSRIGVELDSFADFVAFGIAPGFLLIGTGGPVDADVGLQHWHVLGLLYVFGCVLRLARFNVIDDELPGLFRGFPSTLCGGLIGCAMLVALEWGVDFSTPAQGKAFGVLLAVLGVLMISPLPVPKVGTARSTFWKVFTAVAALTVYILVLIRQWPEVLLGLAVAYAVSGPFIGAQRLAELRDAPPAAPTEA